MKQPAEPIKKQDAILTGVEKLNLYQKMNLASEMLQVVGKGVIVSTGGGNSYSAVDHDDVTRLVKPVFEACRILAFPKEESIEITSESYMNSYGKTKERTVSRVRVTVIFYNIDKPEEKLESSFSALGYDSGDKSPGKAYSMAVKTLYLKVFKIPSGDKEESRESEGERLNQTKNKIENDYVIKTFANFMGKRLDTLSGQDIKKLSDLLSDYSAKKDAGAKIEGDVLTDLQESAKYLRAINGN